MGRKKEDEFPEKIKIALRLRVGNICSNPECRVLTSSASNEREDKVNSIGIAAHICAASIGGPRYNALMTSKERSSINNGIWLCSNCSIKIDRDEKKYTIGILHDWKREAETLSQLEVGKKLPSENETINTLTSAFTGQPMPFIENAISNIHQATSKSLEALDPRISVKSSYDNNGPLFHLFPKDNISLKMNIHNESAQKFIEKHNELIKHGKDFTLDLQDLHIEGSPLVEQIFSQNEGKMKLKSKKIKATQKLWLVDEETNVMETFDDIQGEIMFGIETFSFIGSTFNDIFRLNYQSSFDGSDKADFNFTLNFEQWEDINLQFLPYFEKLLSLFSKMGQGWTLYTALEINGVRGFNSQGMKVNSWEYIIDMNSFFHYIDNVKKIGHRLNKTIVYKSAITYSSTDIQEAFEIVKALEGKLIYKKNDMTSNIKTTLVIDSDNEETIKHLNTDNPISLTMLQEDGDMINLFDIDIKLPPKRISINSVLPQFSKALKTLNIGDDIEVEFIPYDDNFSYEFSYETK